MDELEQIPIEIKVEFPIFVSAANISKITALTEQAIFEVELRDLEYLTNEYEEISPAIHDATLLRLYRKSGSAFLVREAHSGSMLLAGMGVGLSIWLLNQTIGETIKEAWVESESHARLKEFLLAKRGNKKKAIRESVRSKLRENGIRADAEATSEKVSVSISAKEDEEIENEMGEKPSYRAR